MIKIRPSLLFLTLLLLTAMLTATPVSPARAPETNVITDPPTFQWTYHPATANNPKEYYSGTLEYGEATFNIGGETLTTRAYRQAGNAYTIPGPTLFMQPGKKYVLRFRNTLPYSAASPTLNDLKDPDITNLHTHGVHISGESPGDDVLRMFEGGSGGDYVYDIPSDHMGGTFWYHAHHHGSTFLQISGGAFGLIIIDDSLDNIPSNVANMVERQLVIAFLDSSAAGAGGDTLMSGTFSPSWTVNGKVNGDLFVPPNTWQHWRILLADADARSKTLAFGPGFEVALLARDGVWRTRAPKILSTNSLVLTGASRADVAVRLSANSSITVNGIPVANVFVSGTPDTSVHPFAEDGVSMWSANRPAYLRDLRGITNVHKETIGMGARTINGVKFDPDVPMFTLTANETQEWTIKGATQHPFHLHIYHMQMVGDSGEYEDGEYYDTIAGNGIQVRFDLNAQTSSVYSGTTIMHCHILEHEDQGAMTWAMIRGGTGPPSYPVDGDINITYSEYFTDYDVAVKSATSNSALAYLGYNRQVQVTVKNDGVLSASFSVSAYRNSTLIGTQPVTGLAPYAETTLSFPWNTTGDVYGYYVLSATASGLAGERDLTDNSVSGDVVMLTIPGDVNGDKLVNVVDAASVSAHWYPGPPVGPLGYDVTNDINTDGGVGLVDSAIVSAHWSQSW